MASLLALSACGGSEDDDTRSGRFGETQVSGLDYAGTKTAAGRTDSEGRYAYRNDETLRFSIGDLALGSVAAGGTANALTLTGGATATSDRRVTNKLILLQTLDTDGNLNNGIQIADGTRTVVSSNAASIDFDQEPAAFRTSLATLLTALNTANVFTDLDPRPRTARTANAAVAQYARASAPRHEVNVTGGRISGYEANASTWQYLGVPYAKPPVGDLRWRPPQPVDTWTGVRHAVAWGDQAAQNPALERYGEGGMSEDSLYLNVTAPKTAANLPVMVWFHGGGFTSLTSNTPAFNNPTGPAAKGVVVVTVNHRLGPFGYLAHPLLSAESGYNGSGNYGQMDLVAALQWVKANIAAFGGNPNNVTIFGESGGGRKVLSLMASPQGAGLFHKAISQSGTLYGTTRTLAAAEAIGTTVSTNLNATTLAEMRSRTWLQVVAAAAAVAPYTNVDNRYQPVAERAAFENDQHNDVPFMISVNRNDTVDPIDTVKNSLPWITANSTSPHYAALFDRVPEGWTQRGVTAYHAAELTYVFNYPESLIAHYQLGLVIDPQTNASLVIGDLNGNGTTGSAGDTADIFASAAYSATDAAIADRTVTMWTNFAKTGNPSITGFTWPAYTPQNDTYVELGIQPTVRTGLSTVFP